MSFRYVVLHHTGWIEPHFDLMIEIDPSAPLRTWRLDRYPEPTQITLLADHRREYLTYEGPVSNHRGQVRRIASGRYQIVSDSPAQMIIRLLPDGGELILPKSPAQ